MRSGRVSAFFGGKHKQSAAAQEPHDAAAGLPGKQGRRLSVDSLMPVWRSSARPQADNSRPPPKHSSCSTADAAPISFTASVTGSQWLQVRVREL